MSETSSFNRLDITTDPDADWWHYDEDAGQSIVEIAKRIRDATSSNIDRFEMCLSMCTDTPSAGLNPGSRSANWQQWDYEPLALNVVESICGALQAEITQAQPRPMFLTVGGDYDLRRKAQKANQAMDGILMETEAYTEVGPDVAYSGIRFGTGLAWVEMVNGRVDVQNLYPWELLVDDVDGVKRRPRTVYRVRYMSRDEVLERWPEHREAIEEASEPLGEWALQDYGSVVDTILLIESIHLPTRATTKKQAGTRDGRHVIALQSDGTTLHDVEWKDEHFPLSGFLWEKKPFGYWGRGVCDMLFGPQYAINKESMTIDAAHDMAGTSLLVGRGANVVKAHVQNGLGGIIECDDPSQIVPFQPPAVNADKYMYLDRLIAHCFDRVGVSKLQVHGELPDGLRNASGRALRTYIDTSSKRFLDAMRSYENFFVTLAKRIVDLLRRASEEDPSYEILTKHKDGHVEVLNWKDIALADPFTMELWPTNLLPNTPAGKLAELDERLPFFQAMGMDPSDIASLADFPDLKSATELITAPRRNVDRVLEKMLDDQEYIQPEPTWPIAMCLKLGVLKYQEALCDGLDADRLELLRRWILDCTNELAKLQAPAAPSPEQAAAIAGNNLTPGLPPGAPPPLAAPPTEAQGAPIQ